MYSDLPRTHKCGVGFTLSKTVSPNCNLAESRGGTASECKGRCDIQARIGPRRNACGRAYNGDVVCMWDVRRVRAREPCFEGPQLVVCGGDRATNCHDTYQATTAERTPLFCNLLFDGALGSTTAFSHHGVT